MTKRTIMISSMEAELTGPDPRVLRVGVVVPVTGLLALYGPSVIEAVALAAREIESSRTRGDRMLQLVLHNSAGPAQSAARSIARLANLRVVDAFIALHTSATLEEVERQLLHSIPYIFVPGYEGADRTAGFFCAGERPDAAAAGITWLCAHRGIAEWAFVGTDYVWPRTMRTALLEPVQGNGGRLVLDELVPLGAAGKQIGPILDRLGNSGAQGVVINMTGRDVVDVLRAMKNRGLDRNLVRLAPAMDENVLYALNGDSTGKLYTVLHSFSSLEVDRFVELRDRHEAAFGRAAPILTSWGEHAYDGLHLITALDRSDSLQSSALHTNRAGVQSSVAHPVYSPHLAVASGLRLEEIRSVF